MTQNWFFKLPKYIYGMDHSKDWENTPTPDYISFCRGEPSLWPHKFSRNSVDPFLRPGQKCNICAKFLGQTLFIWNVSFVEWCTLRHLGELPTPAIMIPLFFGKFIRFLFGLNCYYSIHTFLLKQIFDSLVAINPNWNIFYKFNYSCYTSHSLIWEPQRCLATGLPRNRPAPSKLFSWENGLDMVFCYYWFEWQTFILLQFEQLVLISIRKEVDLIFN